MSVLAPRRARSGGGRWETIRYALDSNARTFRLCLILIAASAGPCLVALAAVLIHHVLLRERGQPPPPPVRYEARPPAGRASAYLAVAGHIALTPLRRLGLSPPMSYLGARQPHSRWPFMRAAALLDRESGQRPENDRFRDDRPTADARAMAHGRSNGPLAAAATKPEGLIERQGQRVGAHVRGALLQPEFRRAR